MRFGILTPVFDGCLESLELLCEELRAQTHDDWIWMLCSNGYSERLSEFTHRKNGLSHRGLISYLRGRRGLAYTHTVREEEDNVFSLLENIGRRRDSCIKQMDADYLFMIDADAKILDKDMFRIVDSELEKNPAPICIYKIFHKLGVLPIFPISFARIDMLNFCVKASLAQEVGYPTTVKREAFGNDYWYFDRAMKASGGDYLFIDRIFCEHNGNSRYVSLLTLLGREVDATAKDH